MLRFSALFLAAALCLSAIPTHAAPVYKITTKSLSKAGVPLVKCPRYVVHTKSGLATSILPKATVCLNTNAFGKLGRRIYRMDFPLNGKAKLGTPFPDVQDQEGDVQTAPFTIGHYPSINSFSITEFDKSSKFTVGIHDAETGKALGAFFRTKGSAADEATSLEGHVNWVMRGSYYLRIDTSNKDTQPLYNLFSGFMEPYEGETVDAEMLKDAGLKLKSCPYYLLDLRTGNLVTLNGSYSCANASEERIEDTGFTIAPYSLAVGMFMPRELDYDAAGDGITLPFRVSGPTPLTYSVEDPSEKGFGRTTLYLIDIASGRSEKLAGLRGSITGTTTYLNVPGEYLIKVVTAPHEASKYGDISWTVSVVGS